MLEGRWQIYLAHLRLQNIYVELTNQSKTYSVHHFPPCCYPLLFIGKLCIVDTSLLLCLDTVYFWSTGPRSDDMSPNKQMTHDNRNYSVITYHYSGFFYSFPILCTLWFHLCRSSATINTWCLKARRIKAGTLHILCRIPKFMVVRNNILTYQREGSHYGNNASTWDGGEISKIVSFNYRR